MEEQARQGNEGKKRPLSTQNLKGFRRTRSETGSEKIRRFRRRKTPCRVKKNIGFRGRIDDVRPKRVKRGTPLLRQL